MKRIGYPHLPKIDHEWWIIICSFAAMILFSFGCLLFSLKYGDF